MPRYRPYSLVYDANQRQLPSQTDNPTTYEMLPTASANRRVVADKQNAPQPLADMSVSMRGSKNILWSSEGYTVNGITVPALTSAQKFATGSQATNIGAVTQTIPSGVLVPSTSLDVSAYKALCVVVSLSAITGTSIQYEVDLVDDAGTPNVLPLWKPAAATAATSYLTNVAQSLGTAPTITGWTVTNLNCALTPQVKFAWTVVSLTAATWTAFIYGIV